jgi:hypothetical protein
VQSYFTFDVLSDSYAATTVSISSDWALILTVVVSLFLAALAGVLTCAGLTAVTFVGAEAYVAQKDVLQRYNTLSTLVNTTRYRSAQEQKTIATEKAKVKQEQKGQQAASLGVQVLETCLKLPRMFELPAIIIRWLYNQRFNFLQLFLDEQMTPIKEGRRSSTSSARCLSCSRSSPTGAHPSLT